MADPEADLRRRLFISSVKCLDLLCAIHEIEVVAKDDTRSAEARLARILIEIDEYRVIAFHALFPSQHQGLLRRAAV